MKNLLIAAVLVLMASQAWAAGESPMRLGGTSCGKPNTVSNLPTCNRPRLCIVTDGATDNDCGTGGGTAVASYVPRLFYSALMDYGAFLKKQGVKLNSKSKHYVKQKPFRGSDREVRGAILRSLASKKPLKTLPFKSDRISSVLRALLKEKLIEKKNGRYYFPK